MMSGRFANPFSAMIYIDASRYSNTGKRTGVENYSFHLINELVGNFGKNITLISPRKIDLDVKQIVIPFPRLWTLLRLSWEILKNKKIDNLFVPSHVLPLIHPKKSTITIHDVVFKYSPESYSLISRIYLNWATKFAIKHAQSIATPSEATKQDLIKFYRARPEKIIVIPLGFEARKEECSVEALKKFGIEPKKYFLFLGRIEYKKNTDTLIKAFEEFAKDNKEIKLVLAGFPGHGGREIISNIPSNLKQRIVLTDYVKDAEKAALLKNTICFVFPSRFEGFGIPLLEAMDARVPIIASDIPSSKEVAGNSINFFEKEDSNALAKLMKQHAEGQNSAEELAKEYSEVLQKHSWEKCAEQVYDLLTNI